MLKKIFYLSVIFISSNLFAMESAENKDFDKLPAGFQISWQLDENKSHKSIIESYKKYLQAFKLNQDYRYQIYTSFTDFMLKNLTDRDISKLNKYILESLNYFYIEAPDNINLLIRLLITLDKLNTKLINECGWNMLHLACMRNLPEIVTLLIQGGADINEVDDDDRTALILVSADHNNVDVVKLLLKFKPEVNLTDEDGCTAILEASDCGNEKIVELLINAGANPNIADIEESTPLIEASFRGYKNIVKLLINAGADLDAKDDGGNTPLMLAKRAGHKDVEKILIKAGATK
ncbi:ankyrin repeat domain-containing protein [Candidatus Dependentiae bacterium]|nr:ankyrin repeat domain-containing protein [Candidatus Dependentiae bacterium]